MQRRHTRSYPAPTITRRPGTSLLAIILIVTALSIAWFAIRFPSETAMMLLGALLTASAFLGNFAT